MFLHAQFQVTDSVLKYVDVDATANEEQVLRELFVSIKRNIKTAVYWLDKQDETTKKLTDWAEAKQTVTYAFCIRNDRRRLDHRYIFLSMYI